MSLTKVNHRRLASLDPSTPLNPGLRHLRDPVDHPLAEGTQARHRHPEKGGPDEILDRGEPQQRPRSTQDGHDFGEQGEQGLRHSQQHLVQNSEEGRYQAGGAVQRGADDVVARGSGEGAGVDQIRADVGPEGFHGVRDTHGDVVRALQEGGDRAVQVESHAVVRGRDGGSFGGRQVGPTKKSNSTEN